MELNSQIPEEEMARWKTFLDENPRIEAFLSQEIRDLEEQESAVRLARGMQQLTLKRIRTAIGA